VTASTPTHKNSPVGEIHFGAEVEGAVEQAADWLGDPELAGLLRTAYHPGAGYGEAFAKLFAGIFREFGVILLDANDPELHRIAAPIFAASIRQSSELDSALLARGDALRSGGFHEQVKVTPSSTPLFASQDGARIPIHRANGGFLIGAVALDQAELLRRIEASPQQFTPNVLLRPVVQDYLLPTLAYVGGPAEIAYFAQAAVVYEALLGRITPSLPRLAVTLVEPHIKRLLDRYGLTAGDAFIDEEQLRDLMAQRTLPSDLTATFEAARLQLHDSLQSISSALGRLDPTLVPAAAKAGAKMRHQIDRLHTRTVHAELRRNVILARHAAQLSSALYPGGNLQERTIGGIYFVARHQDLLRRLYDAASPDCLDHQVLFL
jgi:bacillithiol biosynthesis cysteine-adding enzyme BshC